MVAIDSYAGGDGRLSPLSTPSATRAVLTAHGIGTKYTLGQNFLVNDDVLKKIVALAEVGENDRVLEVGPGIGTLTIALLKHAASVIAIERDPDLPVVLADTLHPWREKFALIEKDALDVTRDDIVAAMAEIGGDTGYPDRASSAANETAQWAVSQSEDCLSESGYPVVPPTGESQQDSREPQFAHVQADGTLPHFVPERRLRLFNSLKALGTPAAPTVTTRLWGQVTIDTELCRSCRMCTVFCPTGALTRFDAANDAFGVEHRSALCMQCRLCETICPEQAITVAEEVSADEFLSGKKFRFTMQPIGWNPGAEDSIASRMARFIKVDNLQEPQAKVKSFDTAARREYAQAREARRREIREQHSS